MCSLTLIVLRMFPRETDLRLDAGVGFGHAFWFSWIVLLQSEYGGDGPFDERMSERADGESERRA